MSRRSIRLTREQVELARITVEADRAAGRTSDPVVNRIATIDGAPVTVTAAEVRSFVAQLPGPAPHVERTPSTSL